MCDTHDNRPLSFEELFNCFDSKDHLNVFSQPSDKQLDTVENMLDCIVEILAEEIANE